MALLEALAMGLTPIVSDVGGMPEVVQQAGVGAVVPAGDVEGFARALIACASARESRAASAAAARAAFEQHYTIARMCADYDALRERHRDVHGDRRSVEMPGRTGRRSAPAGRAICSHAARALPDAVNCSTSVCSPSARSRLDAFCHWAVLGKR